jgi:hypothetical protein
LELLEHGLLAKYAGMMPDALDDLTPEERRRVYKMLRLNVLAYLDETLDVSVTLTDGEDLGTLGLTQRTAAYKLSSLLIRRWASGRSWRSGRSSVPRPDPFGGEMCPSATVGSAVTSSLYQPV